MHQTRSRCRHEPQMLGHAASTSRHFIQTLLRPQNPALLSLWMHRCLLSITTQFECYSMAQYLFSKIWLSDRQSCLGDLFHTRLFLFFTIWILHPIVFKYVSKSLDDNFLLHIPPNCELTEVVNLCWSLWATRLGLHLRWNKHLHHLLLTANEGSATNKVWSFRIFKFKCSAEFPPVATTRCLKPLGDARERLVSVSCPALTWTQVTSPLFFFLTSKSWEAGSSGEVWVKFLSLETSPKPVFDRCVYLSSATWNRFHLFVCFFKRWLPLLCHQRDACTCLFTSNSSLTWKLESPALCLPVGCKPSADLDVKTTHFRRCCVGTIDGRWHLHSAWLWLGGLEAPSFCWHCCTVSSSGSGLALGNQTVTWQTHNLPRLFACFLWLPQCHFPSLWSCCQVKAW